MAKEKEINLNSKKRLLGQTKTSGDRRAGDPPSGQRDNGHQKQKETGQGRTQERGGRKFLKTHTQDNLGALGGKEATDSLFL